MEPNDPRLWDLLHTRAVSQLHPDFAARTLHAARQRTLTRDRWINFALPLVTAAACALLTVAYHNRQTDQKDALARAEWQQIALETDPLSDL